MGRVDDEGRPPPWAGAPAYVPAPELPPHAPMPGAPPYPAREEEPAGPVGGRARRTSAAWVLAATAIWALLDVVLVLLVGSPAFGARFLGGLALSLVLTAVAVWAVARRRGWGPGVLLLASAPVFWVLRALVGAVLG